MSAPTNPPAKHPMPPQKVFRYVTLRDGYTWYSDQDRECDPSVNEKTTYVPAALLQEERARAYSHAKEMVVAFKEELASGKSVSSCLNQLGDYFRVMAEQAAREEWK